MAHTLPPLPYPTNALEPHIDAQTMEIHHGKHHNAYVTNLNAALEKAPELADKSLEDLLRNLNSVPEAVRTAPRTLSGAALMFASSCSSGWLASSGAFSSAALRFVTYAL